jgi:hypothetical protein
MSEEKSWRLTQINPWSAVKTAFMLAIAASITLTIVVLLSWLLLRAAGVLSVFSETIGDLLGTAVVDFPSLLSFGRVLGICFLISAIQLITWPVAALVWSVLYNLVVALTGGIKVNLREE